MRRTVVRLAGVGVVLFLVGCWKTGLIDEYEDPDPLALPEPQCHGSDITLATALPKVMILLDVSSSMNDGTPSKWRQARGALIEILDQYRGTNIEFGFDVFPKRGGGCVSNKPIVQDTRKNNVDKIIDSINELIPEQATTTPLYQGLKRFTQKEYAKEFVSGDQPGFLLLVSDGADSCGTHPAVAIVPAQPSDLQQVTADLLTDRGVRTLVIGFGEEVSEKQLDAIAQAGGTEFSEYLDVQNKDQLEQAFDTILASVSSCTVFPIEKIDRGSKDHLNLYLDDELIELVPDCREGTGWIWLGNNRDSIQLCEETCAEMEEDLSRLSAAIECD